MKRGITFSTILLREARRTPAALIGLACGFLLGGGGGVALAAPGGQGAAVPPAWVACGVMLTAGYAALAAFLLQGHGQVRLVLHAAGVPALHIAALTMTRLFVFTLPGALAGAMAAMAAGLEVTPGGLLLSAAVIPGVILVLAVCAVWLFATLRGRGEQAP